MEGDIHQLLGEWPYESGRLCVRRIKGQDGRKNLQLRIEMGILQMEITGRPDGDRPHGYESLLHYYRAEATASEEREKGSFTLDSDACLELQMEALQYYHRRITFLEIGEYEKGKRDAERNLQLFDFVKLYAAEEDDRMAMEQYRPFVIGHRVRAGVLQKLEDDEYDGALKEIEEGIDEVREFLADVGRPDLIDESEEIAFLKDWADEIRKDRPKTLSQNLKEQLKEAVDTEDFEKAAELRDRLRTISGN